MKTIENIKRNISSNRAAYIDKMISEQKGNILDTSDDVTRYYKPEAEAKISPTEVKNENMFAKAGAEDKQYDPVNRPAHYYQGKFNILEVQEDWAGDEPLVHAAIKYIARRKFKGKELEDLKKSVWYLSKHIEKLESKKRAL